MRNGVVLVAVAHRDRLGRLLERGERIVGPSTICACCQDRRGQDYPNGRCLRRASWGL
jgi:hypothetical protein